MRSTRMWKMVAVLVAVVLLGGSAVAASASGSPSGKASFTLVAVSETADVPIERGFTFTDRLETTDGVPIDGWDGGRCINLSPNPEDLTQWMCELVFRLPEGDITTAGPFDIAGIISGEVDVVFAVTGGTGAFRNARGEVEIVQILDATDPSAFVLFRLLGASANY